MKILKTLFLAISSYVGFASTPQAVNVIKFADAQTLFLGDSKSATLYAYTVHTGSNPNAQKGFNIYDLGQKMAQFYNLNQTDVIIRDMAIHPLSKEAYIAFDAKTKKGYISQIAIVNQTGNIRKFDLEKTPHTEVKLNNAPTADVNFWDKTQMRSLTFTDIDYHKGKVYVSGMSNAEFSSALRVVDYPFENKKVSSSSIEIFHTVHGQNETRAPIQTLQFVNLNGEDYILAVYTCTPLVLIPVKEIKDGAHIVGKTIAELGYGNTPIDIIKFKSEGFDKKPYEGIILANRNRTAQFINIADIASSEKTNGIGYAGFAEHAGTQIVNLPMTGLLQMDDQDDYHITTIRRNDDTGTLELLSFLKNVYIRLDEYISEYDQPSYQYPEAQLQMKGIQNMLIQDLDKQKFLKP